MSEQKIPTETIVRDGSTIIIAHPPIKQETNYWQLLTSLFRSDTAPRDVSSQQLIVPPSISQLPIKLPTISVQPISPQLPIQEKYQSQSQPFSAWKQSLINIFSSSNIVKYRKYIDKKIQQLDGVDERLARDISQFKERYILTLGDVRVRSIVMAFSSAVLYSLVSCNVSGFVRRARNLGLCFVFMGYWFTPDLFNPFLRRQGIARQVV